MAAAAASAVLPPAPDSLRLRLRTAQGPARAAILLQVAETFLEPLDSAGLVGYAVAAERLARQFGDSLAVGQALDLRGYYFQRAGDARRAAPLLRRAERLLEAAPAAARATNFEHLGELHQSLGRPAEARTYYRRAYALARQAGRPLRQASILLGLSSSYQMPGHFDSAVYFGLRAARQYQGLHDVVGEAEALTDIGYVYYQQQRFPEGMRYVSRAYRLLRQANETRKLGTTLSALGAMASAADSQQLALGYFRRLAAIMREGKVYGYLASAYNGMAVAHERLRHADSAEYYYRQSVAVLRPLGKPGDLGFQQNNLARFYLNQRRYPEARTWATRSLALPGGRDHAENTPDAWDILHRVAEQQGDFATAYRLLKQQHELQLRQQAQQNEQLSADLRVGYETEQAEQRVRLLEQARELSRFRQLAGLAAAGGLSLLLGGVLITSYRRRQRRREAALRHQLAADLHDDVGSLLSQISLQTDLLQEGLGEPGQQQAQWAEVAGNSRLAVRQLNDVVWSLDAHNDTVPNLLDRLRDYAHDVLVPTGRDVRFIGPEAIGAAPDLSASVRRQLYLIYKEALHNILKYSPTNAEVTVALHRRQNLLTLEISNTGPVLDGLGRGSGHGLRNICERALTAGGTAEVGPRAEGGFGVKVSVPVGS